MHTVLLTPQLTFAAAFELWISRRILSNQGQWSNARYIAPRTERDLRQYAKEAGRFFGALRLSEIHAGHLHAYQQARAVCDKAAGDWEQRAGANLIRKEVQTVMRVMRAAGVWREEIEDAYEPLQPVENDVPRAMTPEEQHRFLHVAGSREKWRLAYCYSLVALQTTASTNEMRALRLGDIFLDQGTIMVRSEGAKTKFRARTIPLQTPEVAWALDWLVGRARQLAEHAREEGDYSGSPGPHCYLFPFHLCHDRYDPLRPMTVWGLRRPWQDIRTAAALSWLRPYDLRHTAITRMAEAGVPIHVIMSFAGHMSQKMQLHYTSISMAAKREWASRTWAETAHAMKKGPGRVEREKEAVSGW
jgi:integrase